MSRDNDDFARQYNMGRRMDSRMWVETFLFVVVLLLLGIFLVFSASSPLAPFLYPLF